MGLSEYTFEPKTYFTRIAYNISDRNQMRVFGIKESGEIDLISVISLGAGHLVFEDKVLREDKLYADKIDELIDVARSLTILVPEHLARYMHRLAELNEQAEALSKKICAEMKLLYGDLFKLSHESLFGSRSFDSRNFFRARPRHDSVNADLIILDTPNHIAKQIRPGYYSWEQQVKEDGWQGEAFFCVDCDEDGECEFVRLPFNI